MKITDSLQAAIDYIEEHPEEPLSLEAIASHIGYSPFYLHRLFSIYTGLSLMRYARRRRLIFARSALDSDARVIDIALQYGYSSERAFSRAFRSEFGFPPGKSRQLGRRCEAKLVIQKLSRTLTDEDIPTLDFSHFPLAMQAIQNKESQIEMGE